MLNQSTAVDTAARILPMYCTERDRLDRIDRYLRARNEYHKVWPESVARSVELFQQALVRAPNDPTILAGYAIARARYNFYVGEDSDLARQAAERAVAAGPNLPEAWLAIASVRFQHGDPAGAVRDLKTATAKARCIWNLPSRRAG